MKTYRILGLLCVVLSFFGCVKETGETNDEELITTLVVQFVPTSGGPTLSYTYSDVDGPGGTLPIADPIVLQSNKTYSATAQFIDRSQTPEVDRNAEIRKEATAHRVYWEPMAIGLMQIDGFDLDINSMPLGLAASVVTGASGTGTLKLTLRHYPGDPPGKAAADLVSSSKSTTDGEFLFDVRVQ